MKLYLSTLLSSSVAVTVTSFQMTSPSSSMRTRSSSIRMSDEVVDPNPSEPQVTPKSSPHLQDPMGLYSANSEERQNGQIEPNETGSSDPNTIYDPLNLYATESDERTSGQIKPIEPELVVKTAVVDPLGLYESKAAVDTDAVMSQALPFATRPVMLTGELPGDAGFDPLGFAQSQADLMNYREAEIKHARLAMLAAAGWPLSELFDKKIALALHLTPLLDATDRAPSILNGGLGKVNPFYWMACLGAAAAVEFYGINKSKSGDESYFPGNLGFDPLGVYPKDEEGQRRMQLAEIKNGRLAMISIFGFAIQEFVLNQGVVNETPFFFVPLSETLKAVTNGGYIH
eukprot:scaffold1575_cov242-Chaetoceros_neogracile.AAC.3